jgi:MoaD family protein
LASVKVVLPSALQRLTGGKGEVQLEASTLRDALEKLAEDFGEDLRRRLFDHDGNANRLLNFYINGRNAKFSGLLDAELKDGAIIAVLPAVSGG